MRDVRRFDGLSTDAGRRRVVVLTVLGVAGALLLAGAHGARPSFGKTEIVCTDVAKHTREFIRYNREIELTRKQEEVRQEALRGIPAPCCSDRTALTCCCECNMAKTWWGLSKHLIVNLGYDAAEVRKTVEEWLEFINPDGFSGDACYTGGCFRPFHRNGCGGMSEDKLVLE